MPAAPDTDVKNLDGVPEIVKLEEDEERRYQKALAANAEKEAQTARKADEEFHAKVAEARALEQTELAQCRDEELPNILQRQEQEKKDVLARLEDSFKTKRLPLLKKLTARLGDSSLFRS